MEPTFHIIFDSRTTTKYKPPVGYRGEPIHLGSYAGEASETLTSLNLTALNITSMDCSSLPPTITEIYVDSVTESMWFPPSVRAIYANHSKRIVWECRETLIYLAIENINLLKAYTQRKPVHFFVKSPNTQTLAPIYPGYNSSSVTISKEFGMVIGKITLTRKEIGDMRDPLRKYRARRRGTKTNRLSVDWFTARPWLSKADRLGSNFKMLKQLSVSNARAIESGQPVTLPGDYLFPDTSINLRKPDCYNRALSHINKLYAEIKQDVIDGQFHHSTYLLTRSCCSYPYNKFFPESNFSYSKSIPPFIHFGP